MLNLYLDSVVNWRSVHMAKVAIEGGDEEVTEKGIHAM
jgi:hypothetical protein